MPVRSDSKGTRCVDAWGPQQGSRCTDADVLQSHQNDDDDDDGDADDDVDDGDV